CSTWPVRWGAPAGEANRGGVGAGRTRCCSFGRAVASSSSTSRRDVVVARQRAAIPGAEGVCFDDLVFVPDFG
ncbi:hypothetical protein EE612_041561, partial [Oryza sativa]